MNLLSVSSVLGTIGSVLLAILILLVMITVHEFGHYAAGKLLGFKINEFAIGFGPALFKRRNKKTGELFSVRLVPLGGYCAFAGEDGEEDGQSDSDKGSKKDAEKSAADIAQNNVQADAVHSQGEPLRADGVKESAAEVPGSAQENSLQGEGGTLKSEGAFAEFDGQTSASDTQGKNSKTEIRTVGDDGRLFTQRPPWQRIIVLIAGAFMNYVTALILIFVIYLAFGQTAFRVDGVMYEGDYNATNSFAAGDVMLEADGSGIYLTTDLMDALSGKKEGEYVLFTVDRGGETLDINVKLRTDCDFKNSTDTYTLWSALGIDTVVHPDGQKSIAIGTQNYRFPFFESIGRGFVYSFKIGGTIFRVLGELLTGNIGLDAMGGPITTIKLTSQMAAQGVQRFLEIAAYIGVNLAVFNLLPIPALDGSKVVFCLIEWIFRRPVPRKIEAIIHAAGFVFILGFAVLVDVLQFARCG